MWSEPCCVSQQHVPLHDCEPRHQDPITPSSLVASGPNARFQAQSPPRKCSTISRSRSSRACLPLQSYFQHGCVALVGEPTLGAVRPDSAHPTCYRGTSRAGRPCNDRGRRTASGAQQLRGGGQSWRPCPQHGYGTPWNMKPLFCASVADDRLLFASLTVLLLARLHPSPRSAMFGRDGWGPFILRTRCIFAQRKFAGSCI